MITAIGHAHPTKRSTTLWIRDEISSLVSIGRYRRPEAIGHNVHRVTGPCAPRLAGESGAHHVTALATAERQLWAALTTTPGRG
jgi:hypothetical protein